MTEVTGVVRPYRCLIASEEAAQVSTFRLADVLAKDRTAGFVTMRLQIDYDLCSGNGRCYAMFADLFTDDETHFGQVLGDGAVSDQQLAQSRDAVLPRKSHHRRGMRAAQCPTR